MSNGIPLKSTPVKRRNCTICLFSTDPTGYVSLTGSPWNAEYFVNLNSIMSIEEQSRPYFLHFTFLSQAEGAVGSPNATPPIQVFLNLKNNQFPHLFSNYGAHPVGFLKFYWDAQNLMYGLQAQTNDNEPVYIHSMLGVTGIDFRTVTMDGNAYDPGVRFSIYIHLTPADF